MEPIDKIKEIVDSHDLNSIASSVLEDERFPVWSGASKPMQHHYGKGGLAQHTLEVIELCMQTNRYYKHVVDRQHLVLAALFHDAGKMYDYEPMILSDTIYTEENKYDDWQGTTHKRRIHHISRSGVIWMAAADSHSMKDEDKDDILHAILSHHGQRAWGSPVAPNTKLAWMLHLCDGISARIEDCEKFDRL